MISKEELCSITESYRDPLKRTLKRLDESLIKSAEMGNDFGFIIQITDIKILNTIKSILESNSFQYEIAEYTKHLNFSKFEEVTTCYDVKVFW